MISASDGEGFWMEEHPVTVEDFAAFVAAAGYETLAERPPDPRLYPGADPRRARHPVTHVGHYANIVAPIAGGLLVVISGIIQLVFGLLKFGKLIRFVSFSVMTGLISGLALVLALSQLPTITGIEADDGNTITETWEVLTRLGDIDPWTLGVSALAIALILTLRSTRISQQGAGVSQSVSEGSTVRGAVSRDFTAQGAANIAGGLMRGLPAGGSFKGSILNASEDGTRRWAAIFSGLWMLLIVVLFSGPVSLFVMPALGGLLIAVSSQSVKPENVSSVWRAGGNARLAAIATFVALHRLRQYRSLTENGGVYCYGATSMIGESTHGATVMRAGGSVGSRTPSRDGSSTG